MNEWLVASGKWLRWRPWQWYWVLWKVNAWIDSVAGTIGYEACGRAIQYATSCYVTGGPVSAKEYLDRMVPPKTESTE